MTTVLITIALLLCVALCGWAVAELKSKHDIYEHSTEEIAVEKHVAEQIKEKGYHELGIKDVIATISTKGFKA